MLSNFYTKFNCGFSNLYCLWNINSNLFPARAIPCKKGTVNKSFAVLSNYNKSTYIESAVCPSQRLLAYQEPAARVRRATSAARAPGN